MASNSWVMHHGRGAPLPAGTLVQVFRFNGDVDTFHIGAGQIITADGSPMPNGNRTRRHRRLQGGRFHTGGSSCSHHTSVLNPR